MDDYEQLAKQAKKELSKGDQEPILKGLNMYESAITLYIEKLDDPDFHFFVDFDLPLALAKMKIPQLTKRAIELYELLLSQNPEYGQLFWIIASLEESKKMLGETLLRKALNMAEEKADPVDYRLAYTVREELKDIVWSDRLYQTAIDKSTTLKMKMGIAESLSLHRDADAKQLAKSLLDWIANTSENAAIQNTISLNEGCSPINAILTVADIVGDPEGLGDAPLALQYYFQAKICAYNYEHPLYRLIGFTDMIDHAINRRRMIATEYGSSEMLNNYCLEAIKYVHDAVSYLTFSERIRNINLQFEIKTFLVRMAEIVFENPYLAKEPNVDELISIYRMNFPDLPTRKNGTIVWAR
jgi:hypothetical protein